jgi:argininosuccinate lyase
MVMKALPLAYAKDMQEDKEPVFDALDALKLGLAAMTGMVKDLVPDPATMKRAAGGAHATATDLADWLVRELDLPFRDAHHVTGRIVALADRKRCRLDELSPADLQGIEPKIGKGVFGVLSVAHSVKSRKSQGGTAPANVKREANRWIKRLEKEGLSR